MGKLDGIKANDLVLHGKTSTIKSRYFYIIYNIQSDGGP